MPYVIRTAPMFLCLLLTLNLAFAEIARAQKGMSAREVFAMLPASIFENTAEGLSESEKQRLMYEGHAEFWEVAGETEDVMVFSSLPLHDTAVALRLFRDQSDGSVKAAIGTLGVPICTVELWRVDSTGRAVPVDAPQEPPVSEFLARGQQLPPDVQPTVLICLGLGGLQAQPVFWNSRGMTHVALTNDISYQWNGRGFEKQISPRQHGVASESEGLSSQHLVGE